MHEALSLSDCGKHTSHIHATLSIFLFQDETWVMTKLSEHLC